MITDIFYKISTNILQENILLEPMFEIPGSDILSVHITEDVITGKNQPLYIKGRPVEEPIEMRAEAK